MQLRIHQTEGVRVRVYGTCGLGGKEPGLTQKLSFYVRIPDAERPSLSVCSALEMGAS